MDAQTRAWLDQEDAHMAALIREYGWYIQYVHGDMNDPSFAYTVGLFGLHHPELLIFGVPHHDAAGILNTLGDRIQLGETLLPSTVVSFDEWPHRIIPELVPNPGEIVFAANSYYDRPAEHSVPVLQLSYDDPAGRFPWEQGYAAPHMQPRPGTFRA